MRSTRTFTLAALLVLPALAGPVRGDEGMWTFNGFPFERFEKAYGFRPSQELLDHLRLASVRHGGGGSASFVSADGLVITNHHVGAGCIGDLSTAERNIMRDGFVAATPEQEITCPALEINVLEGIERVTDKVRAVEKPGLDPGAAAAARRAVMAELEKECSERTKLRCDMVTLYQGGEYDLYQFRKFTDVRLAFAPEAQLAQFGGDNDNFEYPRYSMDFSLFRVYVDGKPYHPQHFLKWSATGVKEGDVTFLVGNPGSTGRLQTMAQLEYLRDVVYPLTLSWLDYSRARLYEYGMRGVEQDRLAREALDGVENSIKATSGFLSGLLDPAVMAKKAAEEKSLRDAVAKDPALAARIGDPWKEIDAALAKDRSQFARTMLLDRGLSSASALGGYARTLIRLAEEKGKPSGERLREYRDTALPQVYQRLASTAPIYPDFEAYRLGYALRLLATQLGPVHPVIRKVIGDSTPEEVAQKAVAGTRLGDLAVRQKLAEGGAAAIAAAHDPMIELMQQFEPLWREARDRTDREIDGVTRLAGAKIAETFFAVNGRDVYPDATFSLRISYAPVKGYEDNGVALPWATKLGGYFERSAKYGGKEPFDLPPALVKAKDKIDPNTPADFVTTHDIIGGNSGSPVVNRNGEFVGIVFDGNLQNIPNRFVYTDKEARAICVDARAILETLRKVYPAAHLAKELETGKR
ncbi:MAG: S46 family peptidase [Holophagales bacterium]|nr:MAG: S46 family peptidase [Holophagales bacterium]